MAATEQRELLRRLLDEIAAMDESSFSGEGWEYEVIPELMTVLRTYKRFSLCDVKLINEPELPEVRKWAADHVALLRKHQSPGAGVSTDQQRTLRTELQRARDVVVNGLVPKMSLWIPSAADAEATIKRLVDEAETTFAKVRELLAATEQAAGKVSVARYVKIFSDQAASDSRIAWCWFAGTIGSGAVTLLVTYLLFAHFRDTEPVGAYSIPLGILSLAIVSILSFLFVWCSRTYRAYLHNKAMNLHRHNALMTFEAFAEQASHDENAKIALLQMAASAIFSPQNTGFVGGRESMPMPQAHVIDLFRPRN